MVHFLNIMGQSSQCSGPAIFRDRWDKRKSYIGHAGLNAQYDFHNGPTAGDREKPAQSSDFEAPKRPNHLSYDVIDDVTDRPRLVLRVVRLASNMPRKRPTGGQPNETPNGHTGPGKVIDLNKKSL